jgi:hypothetical protein
VEDAAQVQSTFVRGMARQARFSQGKTGRRNTHLRAASPSGRQAGVAHALRQLEREHIALILAICELEGDTNQPPAMRAALLILLREDLASTQRALTLAAEGRYGLCETCLRPLAHRALMLMPATTHCPVCEAQASRAMQA